IYLKAFIPSAQRWFISKDKDWLLQEDDANPIKRKLRGRSSTSKRLKNEIRRIWRSLPREYANSLSVYYRRTW
ncbi:hypothetical protein ALC62_14734, partial [Cyphomyrmex costatus]